MSNIIEITDFEAPELDVYARLTEIQLLNRHEPDKGLFIAESPNVIERALDAGCIHVSFLVERKHIDGQAHDIIVRCKEIPVYTADFEVLTKLTGFQLIRGMLCAMRRPPLPDVDEICTDARRIAVLEPKQSRALTPYVIFISSRNFFAISCSISTSRFITADAS